MAITLLTIMINSNNWKTIAELIGLAALVLSLIFVGLQMRQTNDIAYMELDTAMVGTMVDIADLVAANAETWVEGNAGAALDAPQSAVYKEMIAAANTRRVVEELHASRLGRPDVAALIRRDWAAFLHQNPGARQVWLAREENLIRYRRLLAPQEEDFSAWRDAIQAELAILDAAAP